MVFPFRICKLCRNYQFQTVIVDQFERAVVFRLGRVRPGGLRGPGRVTFLRSIDSYSYVDIRTVSIEVPRQAILTRDFVTVYVEAAIFYNVREPLSAVIEVYDYREATSLLAASILRSALGQRNLAQVLAERAAITDYMQTTLDVVTEPWGIAVERVDMKNVSLPPELQLSLAAVAEAEREAKAKEIAAEGEIHLAKGLTDASREMMDNPMALQLRYLQTLNTITSQKKSTIVFPFPMNFLKSFMGGPRPGTSSQRHRHTSVHHI